MPSGPVVQSTTLSHTVSATSHDGCTRVMVCVGCVLQARGDGVPMVAVSHNDVQQRWCGGDDSGVNHYRWHRRCAAGQLHIRWHPRLGRPRCASLFATRHHTAHPGLAHLAKYILDKKILQKCAAACNSYAQTTTLDTGAGARHSCFSAARSSSPSATCWRPRALTMVPCAPSPPPPQYFPGHPTTTEGSPRQAPPGGPATLVRRPQGRGTRDPSWHVIPVMIYTCCL